MFAYRFPFLYRPDEPAAGGAPAPATPPAGEAPPAADAPAAGEPGTPAGEPAPAEPPADPYASLSAEELRTRLGRAETAVGAANRRAKAIEDAQAAAQRAADEESGNFQTLYEGEQSKTTKLLGGIKSAALRAEAVKAGERLSMENPSLAVRLVDLQGLEVEVDEDTGEARLADGAAAELERRVKAELDAAPSLRKAGGHAQLPGAGTGAPGEGGVAGMNARIRQAAGR